MFVSAVGITVGVIVSMFGAIVCNLKPFVSSVVSLHDPLIWNISSGLQGDSWAGANGIARLQGLLKLIDLLL